jgi:hypothetical protein
MGEKNYFFFLQAYYGFFLDNVLFFLRFFIYFFMDNTTLTNTVLELECNLPLAITMGISYVIYLSIVRRFLPSLWGPYPDDPNVQPLMLNGEETIQLFNNIGLEFLTYSGGFFSLMFFYLGHVQNLTNIIDLNLNTLDPNVLTFILGRLKFLIINHELIFGVIANYCRMSEQIIDLPIEVDADEFHAFVRDIGNKLLELYRNIELVLDIEDSDLPIHWTED